MKIKLFLFILIHYFVLKNNNEEDIVFFYPEKTINIKKQDIINNIKKRRSPNRYDCGFFHVLASTFSKIHQCPASFMGTCCEVDEEITEDQKNDFFLKRYKKDISGLGKCIIQDIIKENYQKTIDDLLDNEINKLSFDSFAFLEDYKTEFKNFFNSIGYNWEESKFKDESEEDELEEDEHEKKTNIKIISFTLLLIIVLAFKNKIFYLLKDSIFSVNLI